MIDLSKPALHGEGVAVFFDHANPGLFYYLPDCPRLRTDTSGKPELSLLKYRLDPTIHKELGGGLLSLTVDLSEAGEFVRDEHHAIPLRLDKMRE